MMSYSEYLELYSSDVYERKGLSRKEMNEEIAIVEAYLKKYFLPEEEYIKTWQPIQNTIFQNQEKGLPEMVFKDRFSLIALRGGCFFAQEDFEALKSFAQAIGDRHLVIIQNNFGDKLDRAPLRMVYPLDITWSELTTASFMTYTLILESLYSEYFAFSESGNWGKYAAFDYDVASGLGFTPDFYYPIIDIIGFKTHYNTIFKAYFKDLQEEEKIKKWLPPKYKERCLWYT